MSLRLYRRKNTKYRKCAVCRKYKLKENYYNNKAIKDGLSYRCKTCDDKARKSWRNNNLEKSRELIKNQQMKLKYGLERKDYDEILHRQNNLCGICRTDDPKTPFKGGFCIDHCHNSNRVRGLLCSRCNRVLGFVKDNVDILKNMIYYLNMNKINGKNK